MYRQFWARVGHVLIAIAGFAITIMQPDVPLFQSVAKLSGIDWMGLVLVIVPAFSSPTQAKGAFVAIKNKVVA